MKPRDPTPDPRAERDERVAIPLRPEEAPRGLMAAKPDNDDETESEVAADSG